MNFRVNFGVVLTNFFISLRHVRKAQGKMEGQWDSILSDHVHFCRYRNAHSLYIKVYYYLGGIF